jgi:hypothetical protein
MRRLRPSLTLPANDAEAMKALASNINLILPVDACADAPRKLRAEEQGAN